MPQAGKLEGKRVSEIIEYSLDANVLKSAIGVAALNAVSQILLGEAAGADDTIVEDADGFDLLDIKPNEVVSLIGAFTPDIRRLKAMGNPFFIIEKNAQTLRPDELRYFRTEAQTKATLEESAAVIMTGTAIVKPYD